MQVEPLAVRTEDRDGLDRPVHHAEPVRRPRRELDGLAGFDGEVPLAEDEPHPAGKHVHPVLALVHRQFGGRDAAPGADPDLERVQPAGGPLRVSGQYVTPWRVCEAPRTRGSSASGARSSSSVLTDSAGASRGR